MTSEETHEGGDAAKKPGKLRTWWHPLLVQAGRDFAMQHTNTEEMDRTYAELRAAMLRETPPEERLQSAMEEMDDERMRDYFATLDDNDRQRLLRLLDNEENGAAT